MERLILHVKNLFLEHIQKFLLDLSSSLHIHNPRHWQTTSQRQKCNLWKCLSIRYTWLTECFALVEHMWQGLPGEAGVPGLTGLDGCNGTRGLPGTPGRPGADGLVGPRVRAWEALTDGSHFKHAPTLVSLDPTHNIRRPDVCGHRLILSTDSLVVF